MPQLEPGLLGAERRQLHRDEADVTAELPADPQLCWRRAHLDLAAGVALQLVAAAHAQLTRDGQKPARDALGVGERVPHVVDVAVVAAAGHDHVLLLALDQRARDQAERASGIERRQRAGGRVVLCHALNIICRLY